MRQYVPQVDPPELDPYRAGYEKEVFAFRDVFYLIREEYVLYQAKFAHDRLKGQFLLPWVRSDARNFQFVLNAYFDAENLSVDGAIIVPAKLAFGAPESDFDAEREGVARFDLAAADLLPLFTYVDAPT